MPWVIRIPFTNRETANISRTWEGNKIVDHSDVVGASPVRRCSNFIFIIDLTPDLNGLGKDNYQTRRDTFMFWNLARLILETLRYLNYHRE